MGMSIDDLQKSESFGGGKGRPAKVTFLPEPDALSSDRDLVRRQPVPPDIE